MATLNFFPLTTPEQRQRIYGSIASLSSPSIAFYGMVALSTTIAAFGLLADSTAVVIGAMLVAPLMGPIFGVALSLAAGDARLLRQAAASEIMGVVLAVIMGVGIGLIPLRLEFGAEIAARTQPTLYDIIIALASGLAGAYALVDERISPALPGVAIATALVPPLATCGLALSAGQWNNALGAFLLFFANFLAIEIAAALVFIASRVPEIHSSQGVCLSDFFRRFGLSLIALAFVTAFMTGTLLNLIADRRFARRVESALTRQVRAVAGARLSDFYHERRGSAYRVIAVVLTPRPFEPQRVSRMEKDLNRRSGKPVELIVRSLISKDADRNGPVFIAEEELARQQGESEAARFLSRASAALREQLAHIAGAQLTDLQRDDSNGQATLTALVSTPNVIGPAQVASMEKAIEAALNTPLHLIVRSILTRDSDAQQYLYRPERESRPLTGQALRFHRRLEAGLRNQLQAQAPGASLKELRYARKNGHILLMAVARTPVILDPGRVRRMQAALRRYIHPGIELVVRSDMGAETAVSGYLSGFDESKLLSEGPSPKPSVQVDILP